MAKKITLPLTEELAKTLHAGDQVLLTGTIYTSRDAGHKRMCEALAKGEKIPFDPTDATIYYVGPTPAKPGQVIGSAGPTTSGRMDAYAPTMMSVGARGMIGKGARLPEVVDAMKKYSGVYFGAIGGAGALLAKCIKKAELIAYEDLGAEALRKLYVEDMPLVVIIDSEGNNLYEEGRAEYLKEKNMAVLKIEEFDQLNTVFFKNCERNYHPAQIIIEYNGMWKLEDLLSIRYPRSFELQGVYSTVNGTTLDMYLMNMRNMLMEQLTESELIVVNRCADGVNRSGFRRALKVQNPMAQLIFEDMQGKIIEPSEEDLPYDVKGDKIVLDDVDFGVWYVDAYDHPELYLHKEIDFKGQIFRPKGMPDNMFVPVREIMTCCAEDVRYYGYPCKAEKKIDVKAKSWMQIRARFEYEAVSSFGNKQPVLYLIDMEPAAEPEEKVVYLG